jgi:hypothetical protein
MFVLLLLVRDVRDPRGVWRAFSPVQSYDGSGCSSVCSCGGKERRVFRAFKQWNNVVRDQLRNEMGFRLSIGEESQAVPVRVMAGFAAAFEPVIEQIPPGLWRFLLRLLPSKTPLRDWIH